MKITIHTPSAGVRAISIDGVASYRYTIRNLPGRRYALEDAKSMWNPQSIATSLSVRNLEVALRNHLRDLDVALAELVAA